LGAPSSSKALLGLFSVILAFPGAAGTASNYPCRRNLTGTSRFGCYEKLSSGHRPKSLTCGFLFCSGYRGHKEGLQEAPGSIVSCCFPVFLCISLGFSLTYGEFVFSFFVWTPGGAREPAGGTRRAYGSKRKQRVKKVTDQQKSKGSRKSAWAMGPVGPWGRWLVGPWDRGPVVPWARGPVGPWARGPVGPWARGHVGMWARRPVGPWGHVYDGLRLVSGRYAVSTALSLFLQASAVGRRAAPQAGLQRNRKCSRSGPSCGRKV
jgi:hypothetical protein